MSAIPDELLVGQVAAGESAALAELYRRHSRSLHVFCRHLARSDVATDLVHDAFMRVVEAAPRFDPSRALFRTWIFRIARNLCIDWRRSRGEHPSRHLCQYEEASGGDLAEGLAIDGREEVEGAAIRAEVVRAVRECIAALQREPHREALLLYHMGGKVYREIGEILGRSTSMARKLVKAAQDGVRICLEHRGIEQAAPRMEGQP